MNSLMTQVVVLKLTFDPADWGGKNVVAPADWDWSELLDCPNEHVEVVAAGPVLDVPSAGPRGFMPGDVVRFEHPAGELMVGKIDAISTAKNEVVIKGGSGREYVVEFEDVTEVIYRDWVR